MSYRLVIHDDAIHSFDYVIDLFVRVLGVGHREAFELAAKIHEEGYAFVNFFELANVREAEERLLSGGPDRGIAGSDASLAVSVEQVEESAIKVLSRGRVGERGYEPLGEEQIVELHVSSQQLYPGLESIRGLVSRPPGCQLPPGAYAVLALIAIVFVAMVAAL
ncbi:MAG: ATP-dependent Clp protease adaptor ClpS [Planctomycetota bacterium]